MNITNLTKSRLRSELRRFGFTFMTFKSLGYTDVFNRSEELVMRLYNQYMIIYGMCELKIYYKQVSRMKLSLDFKELNLEGVLFFQNADHLIFYLQIIGDYENEEEE